MPEHQDTTERRVKWLRRAARIFGPLSAVCFSLYVPQASCLIAGLWSLGTGGYMDPEMQQWAVGVGNAIVVEGFVILVPECTWACHSSFQASYRSYCELGVFPRYLRWHSL